VHPSASCVVRRTKSLSSMTWQRGRSDQLPLIDGVRACATVGEGLQTLESESGTWEPCRVAARTPRAVGVGGSDVVPDT
jgi:hypothetical protein